VKHFRPNHSYLEQLRTRYASATNPLAPNKTIAGIAAKPSINTPSMIRDLLSLPGYACCLARSISSFRMWRSAFSISSAFVNCWLVEDYNLNNIGRHTNTAPILGINKESRLN
jgi:hypothetical protein